MTTRNLTQKFLELRNGGKVTKRLTKPRSDDCIELLAGRNSVEVPNNKSLPPVWVDVIEAIEDDMKQIELKCRELGQSHSKRLMVDFTIDEAVMEREIDIKTQEITEIFRHSELLLKKLGSRWGSPEILSGTELTIRSNIRCSIAKQMQGQCMKVRVLQRDYLHRLLAQKSDSGDAENNDPSDATAVRAPLEVASNVGFTQHQMEMVDDFELMLDVRDQEIIHIGKSIEELAYIFKELSVLVIDQGSILDRIDYHLENAIDDARIGCRHWKDPDMIQKNSLGTKCICVLLLLIVIMVIVLIVKNIYLNKK